MGRYTPQSVIDACVRLRIEGWTIRRIADHLGISRQTVITHTRGYERLIAPEYVKTLSAPIPPPARIEGDGVIIGDVQLPTTDPVFSQYPLRVAQRDLPRPRWCIIAGDLFNLDAFSGYEALGGEAGFDDELRAARAFIELYLGAFDRLYIIMGNHERRIQRRTGGALQPQHLIAMVTHSPAVTVSPLGYIEVVSGGQLYRVTHARNYSVNQLAVADQLAQKYQCHIIQHHEHHLAIGFDRYKRYIVINNGGLFQQRAMGYATLDDSKSPNMVNGFTVLKGGIPRLYGPYPFSDWSWL